MTFLIKCNHIFKLKVRLFSYPLVKHAFCILKQTVSLDETVCLSTKCMFWLENNKENLITLSHLETRARGYKT